MRFLNGILSWVRRQIFPLSLLAATYAGFGGHWSLEVVRGGEVIQTIKVDNGITDVGMNYLLNAGFFDDTVGVDLWYLSFINNSGFSAVSAADTAASHAGWTEFTSYSEVTRPAWGPITAAARTITNTTPAVFTITGSGTLKGLFVTTLNTKGGSSGTLWSTAIFASLVPVAVSDEIRATYSISG